MQEIINAIKEKSKNAFPDHLVKMESFIKERVREYNNILGFEASDILKAMEERRTYSACNYYKESNFPSLNNVRVFKNLDELLAEMPSKKFRCCVCNGITTDPYECNSGIIVDKKVCDWKAFGLFKTMGKGLRFTFSDTFLNNPKIDEVFMPIEFETVTETVS